MTLYKYRYAHIDIDTDIYFTLLLIYMFLRKNKKLNNEYIFKTKTVFLLIFLSLHFSI